MRERREEKSKCVYVREREASEREEKASVGFWWEREMGFGVWPNLRNAALHVFQKIGSTHHEI